MAKKTEEKLQTAVSNYIKLQYPNVIFTSESSGLRVPMHLAIQMKKQRSNHKLPDLIILEPRGGYTGLIIELKKDTKSLLKKNGDYKKSEHIEKQLKTLKLLSSKGYLATFSCGFDATKKLIDEYMSY